VAARARVAPSAAVAAAEGEDLEDLLFVAAVVGMVVLQWGWEWVGGEKRKRKRERERERESERARKGERERQVRERKKMSTFVRDVHVGGPSHAPCVTDRGWAWGRVGWVGWARAAGAGAGEHSPVFVVVSLSRPANGRSRVRGGTPEGECMECRSLIKVFMRPFKAIEDDSIISQFGPAGQWTLPGKSRKRKKKMNYFQAQKDAKCEVAG
jgi:hypothetical protein